ncbi:MAG: sodium:glutamate symporter, partial [Spirochaetota bacterium]
MEFTWSFFIDIGLVSTALLGATYLRTRVRFLQTYLIPNAITAGFLLLPLYNYASNLLELSADNLGELVYHLMSISFIAITLRASESTRDRGTRGISGTTVSVVFQYGAQAFLGLLLTWVLMNTILPDLFPAFGFFVPLGFALGPGQAFAIGRGWEAFGFSGAGSVGLTFAAVGFLLASFGGVFMVNYGYRNGWSDRDTAKATGRPDHRKGFYSRGHERPVGS